MGPRLPRPQHAQARPGAESDRRPVRHRLNPTNPPKAGQIRQFRRPSPRVVIVPAFDMPRPPGPPPPSNDPLPPLPPLIVPRLDRVAIVPAFDTPAPPTPPSLPKPPVPPLIVPLASLIVVIGQVRASIAVAAGTAPHPVMIPLPVTVMAPPLLKIERNRREDGLALPRALRERPIRRGQGPEGDERSPPASSEARETSFEVVACSASLDQRARAV